MHSKNTVNSSNRKALWCNSTDQLITWNLFSEFFSFAWYFRIVKNEDQGGCLASSILALYSGAFSMQVSPSWDLRILEFLLPAHFQDQVPKCSRERNCGVSIELLHIGTWCFYLTRRRNFLTRGTDAWFSLLSPSKCASTEKKKATTCHRHSTGIT